MIRRLAPLVAAVMALSGCSGVLDPAGEGARRVAVVWWLMFALGTAVFVAVVVLLLLALRKPTTGPVAGRPLVVVGGIALPAVVLALLTGATVWAGDGAMDAGEDALVIEVTGHQYWWDVRYPEAGVRTANEIHLPVGREVELQVTSDDVIHSFWVPRLHGKIDLIPGDTNRLRLEADDAGSYEGQCAEFCGLAHAQMRLLVVAMEAPAFDSWLEGQGEPSVVATADDTSRGREVFLGSACVYCHRVDGTNATSEFGPDLTHLASRSTLGAGVLDNTRAGLAGWLVDPQHHKPGNEMPATQLDGDELQDLLAYLESLE